MIAFTRICLAAALGLGLAALGPAPGAAQPYLGEYVAVIGAPDLVNSSGRRLTEPWQVIRQDRANLHRFGISQPGDQWDPWFADAAARAQLERLVQRAGVDPAARRDLMAGGATVEVRLYGWPGRIAAVALVVMR